MAKCGIIPDKQPHKVLKLMHLSLSVCSQKLDILTTIVCSGCNQYRVVILFDGANKNRVCVGVRLVVRFVCSCGVNSVAVRTLSCPCDCSGWPERTAHWNDRTTVKGVVDTRISQLPSYFVCLRSRWHMNSVAFWHSLLIEVVISRVPAARLGRVAHLDEKIRFEQNAAKSSLQRRQRSQVTDDNRQIVFVKPK